MKLFGIFAAIALLAATTAWAQPILKTAVFAGGCFWSAEHDMEHVRGVKKIIVGYAGGTRPHPTYENHNDYLETIKVNYDPTQTSYAQLVSTFLRTIDPTDPGGQFCDRGPSYRTAIFAADADEGKVADTALRAAARVLKRPVVTMVLTDQAFWIGETYHQEYAHKHPTKYAAYRTACGRDAKIAAVWTAVGAGH